MNGVVDYLCNSFLPHHEAAWSASISKQGVPVKTRTTGDDSFTDAATMVQRMDELGIATLLVAACDPHPTSGAFNFSDVTATFAEVQGLGRAHPGRFAALWSPDPTLGMAGVRRAADVLQHPWVAGLYLHVHSFDRAFDHADHYPYYALCAELGVPVVMQAGTSGGLMPSECGRPIGIDRPAIYFPDTNFVLSHTGWPWVTEAIAMALKFPNVYLGVASYPPRHWGAELVQFIQRCRGRKVIFGTNFPTVGHRHALGQLADLDLTEETRANLLEGAARAIFDRL